MTIPIMMVYGGIPHVIAVLSIFRYLQVCFYLFVPAGSESYTGVSLCDRSSSVCYRVVERVFNADVVVSAGIDNHCGAIGGVIGCAGNGEIRDGELYTV